MDAPELPRIRTLKPEHRNHPKVARLSDAAYRLWVGLINEVDDDGRVTYDPGCLNGTIFVIRRKSAKQFDAMMAELQEHGLAHLYTVGTPPKTYLALHDFIDHQPSDKYHYHASKLPAPDAGTPMSLSGDSQGAQESLGREGNREGNGTEGKGTGKPWPAVEALVSLYNDLSPDECPSVETLSPMRRRKIREFVHAFPEEAWWRGVFTQMHRSPFLRGKVRPKDGRKPFVADLDWLLAKGQDGVENAVKVADGKYRDG